MQTEKLIPVTIDRNRWLRGSVADARLRNPLSGHECCVGFMCEAVDYTAEQIERAACITELHAQRGAIHAALAELSWTTNPAGERIRLVDPRRVGSTKETESAAIMYRVNDDQSLSEEDRERHVRTCGRALGFDIRFRGRRLPRPWHGRHDKALKEQLADAAGRAKGKRLRITWLVRGADDRRWRKIDEGTIETAAALEQPQATLLNAQDRAEGHARKHRAASRVRISTGRRNEAVEWYKEPAVA